MYYNMAENSCALNNEKAENTYIVVEDEGDLYRKVIYKTQS